MKEFDEISVEAIIEAAIVFASQYGWNVRASDCRVKPIQNKPAREGGERDSISLPVNRWRVYLTPKNSPYVVVKRLPGAMVGESFYGMER